ncbi:MAG: tetratricopeptide repeat protein [Clostridiales bacterium]|nr:tetratricopeptide repeat protein [Clostridiales bacterium]
MDTEKMAKRIKSIIVEKGLTRDKLGEGFSKGYISKLESGEINPTVDKLELVSRRLDVSLDYLDGNDNCKTKNCVSKCDHLFIKTFVSLFSQEYSLADKYMAKLFERLETMDEEESGFVRLMAGILSFRLKKYGDAIEYLSKITSKTEPLNSLSILYLARSYSHSGNLDMSLSLFNRLLNNDYIVGSYYYMIYLNSLYHFAYTLLLAERYVDAKRIALKYLEICNEMGHRDRTLEVYDMLGIVELSQENYLDAANYFRKELAGYKIMNDFSGLAIACNHLAEVYSQMKDISKALKYYHKSISYYKKIGNNKYIAYNLNSIAGILFEQGNLEDALSYANSALEILNQKDPYAEKSIAELIDNIKSTLEG